MQIPSSKPLLVAALLVAAAAVDAHGQLLPSAAPRQAAAAAKRPPLFRHANLDAAWRAAQKSGRPMLVYVKSKQCHFCEKMARETWSHPQIAQAVSQRFEPVSLLKEDDPALAKRLGVRAYPTTVVVTPKGELAGHLRGFADPKKFAALMLTPPAANRPGAQTPGAQTAGRGPTRR